MNYNVVDERTDYVIILGNWGISGINHSRNHQPRLTLFPNNRTRRHGLFLTWSIKKGHSIKQADVITAHVVTRVDGGLIMARSQWASLYVRRRAVKYKDNDCMTPWLYYPCKVILGWPTELLSVEVLGISSKEALEEASVLDLWRLYGHEQLSQHLLGLTNKQAQRGVGLG